MSEIYAHSKNDRGDRQLLVDHLRNVACLARELANPFGGGGLAFLAGLWHDVGKADPKWQELLIECEKGDRKRVGIDHKCAGVLLAKKAGGFAEWAGLLIHAHHGGLRNRYKDFEPWLQQKRLLPGPGQALERLSKAMPDLKDCDVPIPPAFVKNKLDAELFLRMTYSALVDADSLDTEAHKLGGTPSGRGSAVTLTELWRRYEAFLAKQSPVHSPVNCIRSEVYDACLRAAREPRGVFRLTVPTGGGKTRSAMAFALRHGIEHGLRRVVVAVPFTTITQQTADVYRGIFENGYRDPGPVVLEHHSGATDGSGQASDDEDSFAPAAVWWRLAAENWDAPVVVTTTVQLFESLFSNWRGKTRKVAQPCRECDRPRRGPGAAIRAALPQSSTVSGN